LEQDRNNNGTYAVIIWLLIGAATLKLWRNYVCIWSMVEIKFVRVFSRWKKNVCVRFGGDNSSVHMKEFVMGNPVRGTAGHGGVLNPVIPF
jgi:hypothetical protein